MFFCFLRQDGFATKDNKTIIHHGGKDYSYIETQGVPL